MRILVSSFFIFSIFISEAAFSSENPYCSAFFSDKSLTSNSWLMNLSARGLRYVRNNLMLARDSSSKIERRPKIMTTGERIRSAPNMDPMDLKIDSADPSLIMPIVYPDGTKRYRINFSGLRYIEHDRIADFYSGGPHVVKRSRGFYADGTEMIGPYHNASWPWDVVIYKNDQGENIALGGVMKQAQPGKLPTVAENNPSRSRWWGKVKHVEISPGQYEEHIIWQGPVHDFNRKDTFVWEYHGYGGTLLTKFNAVTGEHELVKNKNGNYLLFYERVLEQRQDAHGNWMPWVTNLFMREMDPSMKKTVGPEIEVTDMKSKVTGQYFEATRRGGLHETTGYLAEGGNVLLEKEHNLVLKAFSGNDYVRRYGIYLDYLPPGKEIDGHFIPVVDNKGELVDFAAELKLRELVNGTWLGRPQFEYDPTGKLWLRFHYVPIDSLPAGVPIEGWPTAEQYLIYGRITAQVPVKIVVGKGGVPKIELDIDPEFQRFFQNP